MLGVARSALGRPWKARLDQVGEARALAIVQAHGLPDVLARVLAGRGVSVAGTLLYLEPRLRDLMPDPLVLVGMDQAIARLALAIERGDPVAIFGDYDVDGACSSALLADFLTATGTPHRIHIPDRVTEGYGPNVEAIRAFAAEGARLLVTVDCGTTSHGPLSEAQALGLDPIVLDHHLALEILPSAIVVNPNRQDCLSGLGQLCAAGVVFLTLVALNRLLRERGFWSDARPAPDLLGALDLVALATVADVAALSGLNRAFVHQGLAVMANRSRPGLAALIDVSRLQGPPQAWHLGFLLGPRINAGGRIGDAALGARLLTTRNPVEAEAIAAELDRLNTERRAVEAGIVQEAEALMAQAEAIAPCAIIVARGQDWPHGIVGLVASRLREKFNKPAFAIGWHDQIGIGSGRSVPGVNLGAAVASAVAAGILDKGGGHPMAAGITIQRARLGDFEDYLSNALAAQIHAAGDIDALIIDASLSAAGVNLEIAHALTRAGPFGAGNPEPVFVLPGHRIVDIRSVGEDHLRIRAAAPQGAQIEIMAFRAAHNALGALLAQQRGGLAHLAVTLSLDHYRGREKVQARLVDAAAAQPA